MDDDCITRHLEKLLRNLGKTAVREHIEGFQIDAYYLLTELHEIYGGETLLVPETWPEMRRDNFLQQWPTGEELFRYDGHYWRMVPVGFPKFTVCRTCQGWVAQRLTVPIIGDEKVVRTSRPYKDEMLAWAQNILWHSCELTRRAGENPNSYENLVIVPRGCRPITQEDIDGVLRAQEVCKRRKYRRLWEYCQLVERLDSREQLAMLIDGIPAVKRLDTAGELPGAVLGLISPRLRDALGRIFGAASQVALSPTALMEEELAEGFLRIPYGAMSSGEQATWINAKLQTCFRSGAIERCRQRLRLCSLLYSGRPSPFCAPLSACPTLDANLVRQYFPEGMVEEGVHCGPGARHVM